MPDYDNRIVGYEPCYDPEQLLPHPENWRIHPKAQQDALKGSLEQLGWIDCVTVNVTTQHVVDGHARAADAISAGSCCPVMWVDLTEDEELVALASFDTITGMAATDQQRLASIADRCKFQSDALADAVRAAVSSVVREMPEPERIDGEADTDSEPAEPAEPAAALAWGYLGWKGRRVQCSETEINDLEAAYQKYEEDNDGLDIGFVRWLVHRDD